MTEPTIFFSEVNERQGVFTRRAFLMGGLAGAGLGALTGRLAQLQLIQTAQYRKAATDNQYNARLVTPPRGLIIDRNGTLLASNRGNFRVLVARDKTEDLDATLEAVAQLVPISDDRRRQIRRQLVQAPRFTPVSVAEDLTWEQFAAINIRAPELPGVTAEMGEVRVYPFGGAFAHVIGYVTRITDADLKKVGPNPDRLLLHPSFRIGKQGIEKALDKDLRGKAGEQKVEVDAKGRVVRMYPKGDVPATPGKEVILTLDADIQNRALEVFGEESGAAVMMDCRTGDILCMASCPSFDANKFVRGVASPDYAALTNYERKPLYDKALAGIYPPGSTFKTVVSMAALEAGIDPGRTYTCNGALAIGNRVFHCDRSHGTLNMHDAIKTSCDIFFYQTALSIGIDAIAATARKFGLGQTFDIGISGQKAGLVPDLAYKRRTFPKDTVFHPGETASCGIGQGYMAVNPLQLCVMTARLANGAGKAVVPRLIRSIGGQELPSGAAVPDLAVSREHLEFVRAAMAAVTESGTAASTAQLGLGPIKMAGKTGTAQSHSYGAGSRATLHLGWALRDHAWFVAFAPFDDPRYAISVLVEHGGWGASAAAPRARELMRMALLKDPEVRKRIEAPTPLPPLPSNPDDVGPAPEAPTPIVVPGAPAPVATARSGRSG